MKDMRVNKKRIGCFIIVLVVLALLAFTIAFFGFGIPDLGRAEKAERRLIKEITNIEVPQNTRMLYRYDVDLLFPVHGRQTGYSVYQFDSEPTDWLKENGFSNEPNEEFSSYFQSCIPDWISSQPISQEYIPDFSKPYYWLQTQKSKVYFVYQPDKLMLMVFIHPF